jgi:hypothetical protein
MARETNAVQGLPFFAFLNLIYRHLVELLAQGYRPVARTLPTQENANIEKKQTCVHDVSEIRTHDSRVSAVINVTRIRPSDH